MNRQDYARLYGPTTGDLVRLADTNLFARVEHDYGLPGHEPLTGFLRPVRDGMLITASDVPTASLLDLIIVNAMIMDPVLGIFKGCIGIKDGRIAGIGRAGNPDVTDDIDLIISGATGLVSGEGLIATPGAIDSHVHLSSTSLISAALSAGITTFVAQGSGGIWDLGVNPANNMLHVLEAFESIPINLAVLARGSSNLNMLQRHVLTGAAGLKIHEDVGAFPAVIDACLTVADQTGVQVAMHTDGVNEAGSLAETISAIAGRSIHAYHVEGSGGGHSPDLLEICAQPHVLGSSTNPTLPYSVNSLAEQRDMIMTVHRLNPFFPEDVAATDDRIRASTIAAEDVLHDLGAIAMTSSDSQGMGRIGEVVSRTWQVAHRMKELRGGGYPEHADDNERILRYLAKYTINPAIAHGLATQVGSLEPGKLADIVLWQPAFFGAKPQLVIKGGFAAWAPIGDGNGSTRSSQPMRYGPMWGGLGDAPAELALNFISPGAHDAGFAQRLGRHLRRRPVPIAPMRSVDKSALVRNTASPEVRVDPESYDVSIDGEVVDNPPAEALPLTRRYYIA